MEKWNLKELNDMEVKEQYLVKISNRFASLEILNGPVNISRAWENITDSVKTAAEEILGYYDLQEYSPWINEECLKLLDKRKQALLHWLQNPSQMNGNSLNIVWHETSSTLNQKWGEEYLKYSASQLF